MKLGLKPVLMAIMMLLVLPGIAQNGHTIEFVQEMTSDDSTMMETIEMMGEMTSTWYIQGTNFRGETDAGMTGTTTIIYNQSGGDILMLMESPFLGNTYMMISDSTDAEDEAEVEVVKTKQTKKIAGYKCVKYVITDTSGVETIVYATDKIENPFNRQYGDEVQGTILYSETESEAMGTKMRIIMTATKVTIGPIEADKFSLAIPDGYTEIDLGDD